MPRPLYLVHDLSYPAVRRRLIMLTRGGATVDPAGFSRAKIQGDIEGVKPVNLGETADGRFVQRIWAVLTATAKLRSVLAEVSKPDVIIARNLETLVVANRAACDRRNWATDEADRKNLVSWLAGLAPAEPGKTADHFPISSSFAI
jgi:hypothetical protein